MITGSTSSKIEFVHHDKLRHVSLIVVNLLYRNMHEHSDFEMNYVLSGNARIIQQGREFVASAGDFFIANPYEPHEIISDATSPVQLLCLQLSKHFCEEYSMQLKNVIFTEVALKPVLADEDYRQLLDYYFSFCEAYLAQAEGFQLECIARLAFMTSWLIKNVPHVVIDEKAFDSRRANYIRARRLQEYVDDHYKEKILLDTLAAREGLSRTYISHIFHECLNVTFQDYLNKVRLEHAIHLMLDTDMEITAVCMESGFSDNKYLNQMLRKEFNCNASEFRKKYGQGEIFSRPENPARGMAPVSQKILDASDGLEVLKNHRKLHV